MMNMWKFSHRDVCDCGKRHNMSHLYDMWSQWHVDIPVVSTLAGVNCGKHWEESI